MQFRLFIIVTKNKIYIKFIFISKHNHLIIIRKTTVLYFNPFHNVLKSMAFVSGEVQKDSDWKHLLRHSKSLFCSLPYLITSLSILPLAKSIHCDQSFLLRHTWVFSLVMRIYIVHSTLTGYVVSLQVRALHSWVYHFWMSPEWTTLLRLTLHDLKNFQFSDAVWGRQCWGRWIHILSLARWDSKCDEVTPSSGKH
jgi:hypothetical protein